MERKNQRQKLGVAQSNAPIPSTRKDATPELMPAPGLSATVVSQMLQIFKDALRADARDQVPRPENTSLESSPRGLRDEKTQPTRLCEGEVHQMHCSLEELAKALCVLEDRLEPVLTPQPDERSEGMVVTAAASPQPTNPLAHTLCGINYGITSQTRRVLNLLRRLE